LVGSSADGPVVTTSPLGTGVLLEVLPQKNGGEAKKGEREGSHRGRQNLVRVSTSKGRTQQK